MSEYASLIEQANQSYRAGKWEDAAGQCRELLRTDPRHAAANHLLGLLELHTKQVAPAIEHLQLAAAAQPAVAQYQQDLSRALRAAGQFERAIEHARQSVRLAPLRSLSHVALGNALRDAGQLADSENSFRDALRFDARSSIALSNLAGVLVAQKKPADALPYLTEAARVAPESPALQFNLAECLQLLGRTDEAADAYRQAIKLFPDFAAAHHKLGALLTPQYDNDQAAQHFRRAADLEPGNAEFQLSAALAAASEEGALDEVLVYYRRVVELNPGDLVALHNLSAILVNILISHKRFAEALPYIERNLQAAPKEAQWHDCMATCLAELDKFAESLPYFDQAIKLAPDNADTHYFHGHALLAVGDFAAGWPEFMWRLKTADYADGTHHGRNWDGEPLDGKPILVYAEGGIGDTFQFLRFLPMVEQRGGKVLLEVQASLIPFLKDSGIENVVPRGSLSEDPNRLQVSLFSLPAIFNAAPGTIPLTIPYLSANPALVKKWRNTLEPVSAFRVGIHWQPSSTGPIDKRAIPLEAFESLARIPGVSLVSLQKNPRAPQEAATFPHSFPLNDLGQDLDRSGAFQDTAAVMKNLDLIITCDTSIPHLAGALEVPVWVALPFAAEWRWLQKRSDTPWYPTMRLFRQTVLNHWTPVFEEIATQLAAEVAAAGKHNYRPAPRSL